MTLFIFKSTFIGKENTYDWIPIRKLMRILKIKDVFSKIVNPFS